MQRLQLLARWFEDAHHLARFLGVCPRTVRDWMTGRTQPTSAALRLLDVVELVEARDRVLFRALVRSAK